jgi:hypothetical protein
MEKKKVKHLEKIHEMLEGSPVCKMVHRMGLCDCGCHGEEKAEKEKEAEESGKDEK